MTLREKLTDEYKSIIYYIGVLTIGVSITELLPVLMVLFQPVSYQDIVAFVIPAAIGILLGLIGVQGTKNSERATTAKSGALIVTVSWIIAVILGAVPFVISNQLSPVDAIFEAMSGWTTTGLSMVDVTNIPPIYLLWRSLMQYVGGAGIAVLMLTALIGPEAAGLYEAEARNDRLLPSVIDTSRILIKLYTIYFLLGVGLYRLAGTTWFDGINHAMAALSTGGFSTRVESIGYWKSLSVEAVSIFLMILGTVNFSTHYVLLQRKRLKALLDNEIVLFLVSMGLVVPVIAFSLFKAAYAELGQSFRIAIFQAVSALSTAGFQTVPFNEWTDAGIFSIIILMIIGGGTGATAGGIKLYRIAVLLKNIFWTVQQRLYPRNTKIRHSINKQGNLVILNSEHLLQVQTYVTLYLLTYLIGVIVFMLSGVGFKESLFEFASVLGTVGLSIGVTGPQMPFLAKVAGIIGMWLGRLEFMAILISIAKVIKDFRNLTKLML